MKLKHIGVVNYQRITRAAIPVTCPILLLAGENEAGKTSLADAVYHAVVGTARRVSLKKDFGDLVHDGQKRGLAAVEVDIGPSDSGPGVFSVVVPSDKRAVDGVDENPLLAYLLDATKFSTLKPEERRTLLFGITGTRISGKVILERLRAKGADSQKALDVGTVLMAGFKAGHDHAKTKASEARGAWKAVAGENYGSKKAEDWTAPKPAYDAEKLAKLTADIEQAEQKVAGHQRRLGEISAQRTASANQQQRRTALVELVDLTARRQAKLDADQALVTEWEEKVRATELAAGAGPKVTPTACPHCGGLLEIHGLALQAHDPAAQGDPKAIALLPMHRETLQKVTRARDNAKKALEECTNARAALTELDANPAPDVNEGEAASIQAEMQAAHQTAVHLTDSLQEQQQAKAAAERAEADTKKAAGFHKDVSEWEEIADWLAPSGIQSELLTEAMKPFSDRFEQTAKATGWGLVSIDMEMTVRIDGRPYSLCSESARWRADAVVVEAMAYVSGVKTFMLDAMEVLIGANRLAFLKWMHQLATRGELDTAILIGSFKEKPQCPPTFQVEWVEAGRAGVPSEQEQEAA